MSDSPDISGDDNTLLDNRSTLIRPIEQEDNEPIPSKRLKALEEVVEDDGDDDEAVLDDGEEDELDEEELDQSGELVDGNDDVSSDEAAIHDIGESSDIDDYVQANLANINDCQTEIDSLNKDANDEILKVAQKYNQLRQPIYARRNKHIDQIPNFWCTVFSRHPQLKRVVTQDDLACLKHLVRIQLNDFEEGRSGYRIEFHFSSNPWFSNSIITKEYHLPWHDAPSCACSAIDWYPGMDLTKRVASFFCWFCSQDDASTDDIAEIIKEELWPDPLQCFMLQPNADEDSVKSVSDDQSGDDDVEYISSEDETWKKRPAFGKEAPGRSSEKQYVSDEEESDAEDEGELDGSDQEEFDENDADLLEEKAEPSTLAATQSVEKGGETVLDASPEPCVEVASGKTKVFQEMSPNLPNDHAVEASAEKDETPDT